MSFPSRRPAADRRCFTNAAVEATINRVAGLIADRELAWLFSNCLPNTLDTTTRFTRDAQGRPDTYLITGDIDAMWLRDSTAQVWPYLRLIKDDAALRDLVNGLVRRQARCVLLDPYANAFYSDNRTGEWINDRTAMKPGVHERKWELDSLCAFFRLSAAYWRACGDTSVYEATWLAAFKLALDTIEAERPAGVAWTSPTYRFERIAGANESLDNGGRGTPARGCGLISCAFRPSDDACKLPILVPANAMLVAALRQLLPVLAAVGETAGYAHAVALADSVDAALHKHAVVNHPEHGDIWAYEIDGYGSVHLMDDANVPSLLSLPYLGYCSPTDPRYLRTRAFLLSESNPYFVRGARFSGIGGPHATFQTEATQAGRAGLGSIWPISIAVQALTSDKDDEIRACLRSLRDTHGGTGFMHESFNPENPAEFQREWFAWANTLFGELILHLEQTRPHILKQPL